MSRRRSDDDQPLFDFSEEKHEEPQEVSPVLADEVQMQAVTASQAEEVTESTWREVPQARFLSWSHEQQMAYCAARDMDSALWADNEDTAMWFLERAESYRGH